jgi:riboflavin biosynthesis pyrimidine reductase
MHVVWYTAMSMDGRIADAANSLEFLNTIRSGEEGGGDDFATFLASIDAVVVGATTLRWLIDGGHGWPHDDLPTWLVSHDEDLVDRVGPTRRPFQRFAGDVGELFATIEAQGYKRVWLCGGGAVAGQTLAAGRIDEVVVTIAPTALGAGPNLFDAAALPQRLFTLADVGRAGSAVRLRWLRT